MDLRTLNDSNNGSCKNCGHGSHCGTPLYASAQHYQIDGGEYYEIKICDSCRCEKCSKPKDVTWKQVLKHMRDLSNKR